MKYETFAPMFPGFYNTVFQYERESEDIEYYNEENGVELEYDDFEWDYADYETRIGKAFVSRLESELKAFLPIKIEYQSISSPREYNFKNDSINIAVSLDLRKLLKLIRERRNEAAAYFRNTYTSGSGFISFHSNDINDWLNKDYILDNPAHRIGALLDCLCSIELNEDDIVYWCDNEMYINYSVKEPIE
jgi:hypothetical protein